MDPLTSDQFAELVRTASLTMFLLFAWAKEREERIKRTEAYISHLEAHKEGESGSEPDNPK